MTELPEQESDPNDTGPLPPLPDSAYPPDAVDLPDDELAEEEAEPTEPGPNPYIADHEPEDDS